MAGTTGATIVSDYASSIYSAIIEETALRELRGAMFMRPHFKVGGIQGNALSFDFQLLNKFAATSIETNKTETEVFTTVEQTTTFRRATSGLAGSMSLVGDVVKAASNLDVMAEVSGQLSRAYQEEWETVATANLANFSNTTTAAAGSLAYDDVLLAISALEQRDVTAGLCGGFHPKALADVRTDAATRTSTLWARDNGPDAMQRHSREYWGDILDVPCYASTTVSSSAGNYQSAVFADVEALGLVEKWGERTELWRDARIIGTYVVLTGHFGMCEIDDQRGQTVLSSTS